MALSQSTDSSSSVHSSASCRCHWERSSLGLMGSMMSARTLTGVFNALYRRCLASSVSLSCEVLPPARPWWQYDAAPFSSMSKHRAMSSSAAFLSVRGHSGRSSSCTPALYVIISFHEASVALAAAGETMFRVSSCPAAADRRFGTTSRSPNGEVSSRMRFRSSSLCSKQCRTQ